MYGMDECSQTNDVCIMTHDEFNAQLQLAAHQAATECRDLLLKSRMDKIEHEKKSLEDYVSQKLQHLSEISAFKPKKKR